MIYNKIIKDSRGTIRIQVKLWVSDMFGSKDRDGNLFRYDVMVFHALPQKRKEIQLPLTSSIATNEEINEAKQELWYSIRPQ